MLVTIEKVDDNWEATIDMLPQVTEFAESKQEASELALSTILTTAEALGHDMPGYQDLIRKDIYFEVIEDGDEQE